MPRNLPDKIELTVTVPTKRIVEIIEEYDNANALPNEEYRLQVAREWAEWNLGSTDWADQILTAYRHPGQTQRLLEEEKKQ